MIRRLVQVIATLSCVALTTGAGAQPANTTKYSYYPVAGDSSNSIYAAMLRYGPHVNGQKAYAATSATTSQDGKLVQAESCLVQDYRLKIDFVIRLPKIKNEALLSPADKLRWQEFSRFLKKHEETHRSIWLGCAQEMENQARAIHSPTCAGAEAEAEKLWDQMRQNCAAKHNAFDTAEQKTLMQHPFVKVVMGRKSRGAYAVKMP